MLAFFYANSENFLALNVLRARVTREHDCAHYSAHTLRAIAIRVFRVPRTRGRARIGSEKMRFSKIVFVFYVLLRQKSKNSMLTGTGVIATGVAYLNYRNAKSDYEALLEKKDGLLAAVKQFNLSKDEDYIEQKEKYYETYIESLYPEKVKCTAVLRTSYLVGKMFHCLTSVYLTNLSNKTYEIGSVSADCWVQDTPIHVYNFKTRKEVAQTAGVNKKLNPAETMEIPITGGVSAVPDMNALRAMVCAACGKRLITSCGKVDIADGIKVNITYKWREVGETKWNTARFKQLNGTFRYCLELPLYANS